MNFEIETDSEYDNAPIYNLRQPEDVFFQLDDGNVVNACVISDTCGFASCEVDNDSLDYMIEDSLELDSKFGSFVIEGVTGKYYRGDGWMTDDSASIFLGNIRPATKYEIECYGDEGLDE